LNRTKKNIIFTSLFGILWAGALAFGSNYLLKYENAPGRVGAVAQEWPGRQIKRANDRSTLVMVAHPRCPCTEASIGELAQVMARAQGKIAAYVLFVTPRSGGPEWENTGLRRRAAAVPGVTVVSDIDGAEARRFGTETSGHTLLFNSGGQLLFSGGITASRGHAGENAGENAIAAAVHNRTPLVADTLVFGCALAGRARPMQKPGIFR
jgi:hypothetical protein